MIQYHTLQNFATAEHQERGEKLTEYNLQLGASKPFGYASMRAPAVAKGFLGSSLTVHVEGVRIGEDFFVPIGGLVRRDDTLTCFDKL